MNDNGAKLETLRLTMFNLISDSFLWVPESSELDTKAPESLLFLEVQAYRRAELHESAKKECFEAAGKEKKGKMEIETGGDDEDK
nr:spliceosome-associated protein 130 A [Tanacetum cinerariifolium]